MLWTDSSTVVYVPGGSFVMGQDEKEPSDHSQAHTVTLNPFWIYQAEVTNRMYRMCVELGACTAPTQSLWYTDPKYENAPVSGVDWDQAKGYCEWMEGRLPTEAEWELAARGPDARPYPWGKGEPTCDVLNFLDCLVPSVPDVVRSYPLGASPYKVADMAGNVSEWVADWYGEDYYSSLPADNPLGPSSGEQRVVRGSSYLSPVEDTLIYLRSSQNPLQSQPTIGFRCVVNSDAPGKAPMCKVLSYEPIWDTLPTAQPQPTPGNLTSMYFICYSDHLLVVVEADFVINTSPPWGSRHSTYSPPLNNLGCGLSNYKALCGMNPLPPGQPVTATWCFTPMTQYPTCPFSYEYNLVTDQCEYDPGPGGGQCNGGIVVEGYGCLYPPANGQCPAGYYNASYNGDAVCVPAGGPPSPDPAHPLAACPQGLVFNEGDICCEYPPGVPPACPVGYTWDVESVRCVQPYIEWCRTISGAAPDCTPTEEPPEQKPSCTSLTNMTDCQNAGCTWGGGAGPPSCH